LFDEELSFQWSPVPGATSYTLEIYGKYIDSQYSFSKLYGKTVTENFFKIPEADVATYMKKSGTYLYKWRVAAVSESRTVWSEERYFTIIMRGYPYLWSPSDYGTIYTKYSTYIFFSWSEYIPSATKYVLYIYEGTKIDNSLPILEQTILSSSSLKLPINSLPSNKTYSWYIKAYYGEYLVGISEIRTFTVAP
jgi:hypothetical protein